MNLTKEKENILLIAQDNHSEKVFPLLSDNQDTYYLPYKNSKHLDQDMMVYSSDLRILKKQVENMWKGTFSDSYSKDILSAVYQCKDNEEGLLEAIDLYNYMM